MLNQIQPFVNWLRRRNPRARTWRDYHHILTRFASIVQHPAAADVSVHDIDTYIAVLVDDGLQPATINRYLSIVSSFYSYLAAEDPDLLSPIHRRRHFLRKPHRLPRPVPLPDLQRFFAAIDDLRDRALFLLMLRGGLRIAEVAGLQLQDLRLTVAPPRLRVFGKNSKERTIYLSPQMRTALAAYLAVRPAVLCDALFLSYQGAGLSTTAIHKRLVRWRRAAGVQFTAHQLRHSFANDLVEADVPLPTVQKLLGHAWLTTTQTYVAANDRKVQADFYRAAGTLDQWESPQAAPEVTP